MHCSTQILRPLSAGFPDKGRSKHTTQQVHCGTVNSFINVLSMIAMRCVAIHIASSLALQYLRNQVVCRHRITDSIALHMPVHEAHNDTCKQAYHRVRVIPLTAQTWHGVTGMVYMTCCTSDSKLCIVLMITCCLGCAARLTSCDMTAYGNARE